jgi:hypothetical protein
MHSAASTEQISLSRFGLWVASATAIATLGTFVIAIATPPLGGPWCTAGCFQYPYLDVAARFPRDYYWMFPAIVATLLFVAFALALQARAPTRRQPLAQLGVAIGSMAALTLIGDYFLQLAAVQPSLLANEGDGIALLTQFNPHGVFIALEELGYLLMSLSLACLALASPSRSGLERTVRSTFVGGLVATAASSVWIAAQFGHAREYRLEIALISINWLVLIAGAFMTAAIFRRELSAARGPVPAGPRSEPPGTDRLDHELGRLLPR